ncbi:MAG: T9SS type A sorting domain-containing protein [Flavobacteriales bacterium]|nr:T9SS type A sorting domain-containing protein [Flavobacteriales bacterium]
MKHLLTVFLLAATLSVFGQTHFNLSIEEVSLTDAPGLQSFVVGQYQGKWLLIGGRTDGLHQRQPFASFLASGNNLMAYVVDPVNLQHWSVSLSSLPTAMYEQLQSTNMSFIQRDTVLYIVGGYGYSATAGDHITYGQLTAVNVPTLMFRIMNDGDITGQFRSLSNSNMAVTGGYMGLMDDTFYLVCGQYFEGRYNPMGPNNGPGFIQEYTEAIRKFNITDSGSVLGITNYTETVDSENLHRRDYNMVSQIFPNGDEGFTVFSGVFQPTVDLPWHNTVDVTATGYTVNNNFDQLLNQYHSANLPIYDAVNNEMHTLFFGGISRYHYDVTTGNLIDDQNVPFVKSISLVTRHSDGSMDETQLELQMPGFLGSGAEFIPVENVSFINTEILELNTLQPEQPTLVGYIYGGIESTAENIFFINTGTQSQASGRLFKVFITATETTGVGATEVTANDVFQLEAFPNPATQILNVKVSSAYRTVGTVELLDTAGKLVNSNQLNLQKDHSGTVQFDCSKLKKGNYSVRFSNGAFSTAKQVIIAR